MSGHSKWDNIKHRKARQDKKRSKLFAKLIKEITLQARAGDPNPDHNPGLAQAISRAHEANLPKDSIERTIKRATGELEGVSYEEATYEGYAPGGVAVLVRVVTDNRNRATAAVRHIFTEHGGNMASAGAVSWLFDRKGIIVIEEIPSEVDKDNFLMSLVEVGAEDFDDQENMIEAYSSSGNLSNLVEKVKENGIALARAEITMIPQNTVKVEGREAEQVLKLVDELDDNEDVQEVYANFDIPDELVADISGE